MIKMAGNHRDVVCDAAGCTPALLRTEGVDAADARQIAAKNGWRSGTHPAADHTVDFCPECKPKEKDDG